MSMTISVDEGQIAEAIRQGDIILGAIIEAMRFECLDDGEFVELVAADLSLFLDDTYLAETSLTRRLIEAFEETASNLATEFEQETDQ